MSMVYAALAWVAIVLLVEALSWHLAKAIVGRRPPGLPTLYRPFAWAYRKWKEKP